MRQANKSSHKAPEKEIQLNHPRVYNIRPCPFCEEPMYGMPGGRDAHCANCGFKDPCCGD